MSEKQVEPQGLLDTLLRYGIIAVLVILPFHALLTVWFSTFLGHYELLRLWKEFMLIGLLGISFTLSIQDKELREWMARNWVVRLSVAYLAVVAFVAVMTLLYGAVTPKAVGYGLIVDTRPVLFMLVCIVAVRRNNHIAWARLLVAPAIIVCAFAVLQFFVLPQNILSHAGYNKTTIVAYQTIDSSTSDASSNFIRVQSTMRGPNPLGAYLIPVLTLLILGSVHFKAKRQYIAGIILVVSVLLMTFSRSAVLGAAVSAGVLLGWTVQRPTARRLFWWIGSAVLVVLIVGFFSLRKSNITQNVFFHASQASTTVDSPNELRNKALKDGAKSIMRHPLGGGVGSAGPASVYNQKAPASLSENYFLQIGQETGVVGLALFLALCVVIIMRLWGRRQHGLTRAALAMFIGLIVVNMVSHAWADDTLAYVSWALLAAGITVKVTKEAQEKVKSTKNKNKKGTKPEKPATIAA